MARKKRENREKNQQQRTRVILLLLMSLLTAGVGALMLFVPAFSKEALCYIICIALIVFGIIMVGKFFSVKGFQRKNDYSFTLGILMIALGIVGLIRAVILAEFLEVCFGMVVLFIAIFILQFTIQTKLLNQSIWILELILLFITMASAMIILTKWSLIFDAAPNFTYWAMLFAGIVGIFNFPLITSLIGREEKRIANGYYERKNAQWAESQHPEMDDTQPFDTSGIRTGQSGIGSGQPGIGTGQPGIGPDQPVHGSGQSEPIPGLDQE